MNLPIGQLIQGASQARSAYLGGQKEREHDDLAAALMKRKMEQDAQQQSLRDALTRGQIEHQSAQTQLLRQPQDKWEKVESDDGIYEWNPKTHETRRMLAPASPTVFASAAPEPPKVNGPTGDIDLSLPDRIPEGPQSPSSLPVGRLTDAARGLQPKKPAKAPTAQQHVVDPVTGKVTFFDPTNPPADLKVTPRPPRTGNGAMTNANMLALRGQFNADPGVKNAGEVATALRKVRASATDPSPAGDLSLLVGYMKLLDPGSVVREQEFATAAKSGSLPQQIQAAATKVVNGQRLTPEQRADFVKRSEDVARSYQAQFKQVSDRYSGDAKAAGLDPSRIVFDPFGGAFDAGGSREQQLWDAAVAKHGQAKVEQMYGPRPK